MSAQNGLQLSKQWKQTISALSSSYVTVVQAEARAIIKGTWEHDFTTEDSVRQAIDDAAARYFEDLSDSDALLCLACSKNHSRYYENECGDFPVRPATGKVNWSTVGEWALAGDVLDQLLDWGYDIDNAPVLPAVCVVCGRDDPDWVIFSERRNAEGKRQGMCSGNQHLPSDERPEVIVLEAIPEELKPIWEQLLKRLPPTGSVVMIDAEQWFKRQSPFERPGETFMRQIVEQERVVRNGDTITWTMPEPRSTPIPAEGRERTDIPWSQRLHSDTVCQTSSAHPGEGCFCICHRRDA